jgi:ASC-1-like (ASCH) protein
MAKTLNNTDLQLRKRTRNQTKASSSNPPPPNQPPVQPPQTQPPTYKRFTFEAVEERFQVIKELDFTGKKAFDLKKLTRYNTFERTLKEKGWESLNAMVGKSSNKSIVMEFFANVVSEKEGSYVSRI